MGGKRGVDATKSEGESERGLRKEGSEEHIQRGKMDSELVCREKKKGVHKPKGEVDRREAFLGKLTPLTCKVMVLIRNIFQITFLSLERNVARFRGSLPMEVLAGKVPGRREEMVVLQASRQNAVTHNVEGISGKGKKKNPITPEKKSEQKKKKDKKEQSPRKSPVPSGKNVAAS